MDMRKVRKASVIVAILLAVIGAGVGMVGSEQLPASIVDAPPVARMLVMAIAVPVFAFAWAGSLALMIWAAWLLLRLYFLPTLIAHRRGHPQKTPILLINLLLSFTFIGWVVALVWANSALQPAAASAAPAPSASGFCPHCGTVRAAGAFCPGCGAKLG